MPGTSLSTGETGKLDMIPELQELIIAVRQTNCCLPSDMCEIQEENPRTPWKGKDDLARQKLQ